MELTGTSTRPANSRYKCMNLNMVTSTHLAAFSDTVFVDDRFTVDTLGTW